MPWTKGASIEQLARRAGSRSGGGYGPPWLGLRTPSKQATKPISLRAASPEQPPEQPSTSTAHASMSSQVQKAGFVAAYLHALPASSKSGIG